MIKPRLVAAVFVYPQRSHRGGKIAADVAAERVPASKLSGRFSACTIGRAISCLPPRPGIWRTVREVARRIRRVLMPIRCPENLPRTKWFGHSRWSSPQISSDRAQYLRCGALPRVLLDLLP